MQKRKFYKLPGKILSVMLVFALVLGACVIPGIIPVQAESYFEGKTYDFGKDSGTQYGNVYLEDSSGNNRQISRDFFSESEQEQLQIKNELMATGSGPSGYLFNDADGLFELRPESSYEISLRVKVVSSQSTFVKNNITYPLSSQVTELKLAYGMPATHATNKITMDTEIGMVVKVGNNASVFTATQNGEEKTYNVGEWYTLNYSFNTPKTFGENGNVLGLGLKSFNGINILIDDVSVALIHSITVDPGVGKISQTSFPHKIGDKINIEDPVYKFGYAFEGWFIDKACTKEFTDKYVTEENCDIKLYAGWSETHFSFEGYSNCSQYGLGKQFLTIIDDETAPDSTKSLHYHYTSEYYNQIHSGSVEEGNVIYYTTRRTQRENNIPLKVVKPNTTYVVTFKYKVPANSGAAYAYMATGHDNIWVNDVYVEYLDSRLTLTSQISDTWLDGRLSFTTGALQTVGGTRATVAYIRLYAINNVDTEVYIDDIYIEEATGDTSVTLNANGGAFKDGTEKKKQKVTVGDGIDTLEFPIRQDYDFGGWFYDLNCTQPVLSESVDGTVYLNNLYAGWTRDMGFEGYYYDLEAENRNNYISDSVSIVTTEPHKGYSSAMVVNENSSQKNVIALNPLNNNTKYLVTFHYSLKNSDVPLNVQFASMDMNVNNTSEVKVYDESYTITTADVNKGYLMGAVIVETDFAVSSANRLALLVNSNSAANYTVYFDTISVTILDDNEGYVIFTDEVTGEHKAVVGEKGKAVETFEPQNKSAKFLGWYTDRERKTLYEGGYTYSENLTRIYADFAEGEGFENYNISVSGMKVVTDPDDKDNKYLSVTGNGNIKIADAEIGKKYGVELSYSLLSGSAKVTVGGQTCNISADEQGTGWRNLTVLVTATETSLYLNVSPASGEILIDDLIVYEINDYMSVITFDQKDGYGEDCVRIGVRGTNILFPEKVIHSTDVFYGWYKDSALTTPYTVSVFSESNITLYARWASNPVINITFDDLDMNNLPINSANSNTAEIFGSTKQAGTHGLRFDRMSEETYDTYIPLVNSNGLVRLESNTTYAASFWCYFPAYSSSNTMSFNFFCSSAEGFTPTVVGKAYSCTYATSWRACYTTITTGDLGENNVLYVAITGGNKKNYFYMDTIKLTRIDEGRNHIFANDILNKKLYEVDGNYGAEIDYPEISNANYEIEGWYTDFAVLNHHTTGTHNSEKITELYCRWDLKDINFDNYLFEDSNSKYTVGDDISLAFEEAYDTLRSLKYSYAYTPSYFETANNAASMGRVDDDSTYRISFRYKLKESRGDVDIKFLTAHLNNRWSFITDYDKATYRIYSSEIGNDWKLATVYLTTDFASIGTSGLFMTFNPVIEGETVLYIDDVDIDYLRPDYAVVSFLDKNNNSGIYVETKKGATVSAPESIPTEPFSTFKGWYSDEALTTAYTPSALPSGITYVYSDWRDLSEDFSSYAYKSNTEDNFSRFAGISNGVLNFNAQSKTDSATEVVRLGKVNNNTSYKITFDYKTLESDVKVNFATANEVDFNENTTLYTDKGNSITAVNDGKWHTATAYITTAFTYSVPKDSNVNSVENKNADFGDMLYMYFEGQEISIDNISLKEVNVLTNGGVSVLTEEASKKQGSQALRFYFSYNTNNFITVNVDGENFTVAERGIIFKNARNTATGSVNGNTVRVSPITLSNKNEKGYTSVAKTSGFNQYWDYNNKTEDLVFSGYVKDFNLKDARLIGARAYIVLKGSNGNEYTFYSADKKTTVKEGVELNSEITNVDVHTFAGVQWENFTIVNPKLMPYIYGREIEKLMDYAKETHNVDLPRVTEKAAETTYEIVIGDTKREASELVSVEAEDQYVIAVRGTKVIIKGGSDLATMQGVKDFIEYLKLKDSLDCGANIKDGYTKYGTVSKTEDDYKLVLNENFDGTQFNPKLWGAYNTQTKADYVQKNATVYGGIYYTYCPTDGGYTTASGMKVKDAMFIRDGNCVLTTARINETDFVASELSTFWHMIYQYGYLEINCKLSEPPSHSGWWMNGAATGNANFVQLFGRESRGCMTEYDLIENFGNMNYYAANIHYWWTATSVKDRGHSSLDGVADAINKNQYYIPDEDETSMYDNYHILTFLWENDRIIFALDGVKFYEFENTSQYYDRMPNYINLGQGMGGRNYGKVYNKEIHKDYYETLIDYVRIYQMESMGSRMVWAKE